MDVSARAAHLVRVQLHQDLRHGLLHLVVVLHHAVHRVRAVLHHDVEVGLARLVPRSVKCVLELDDIGVPQLLHDLELAVLVAFVLENLFDRYRLAGFDDLRLVHDPERAAAQDALGIVGEGRLFRGVRAGAVGRLAALWDLLAVERSLDGADVRRRAVRGGGVGLPGVRPAGHRRSVSNAVVWMSLDCNGMQPVGRQSQS
mmetsp:Transcript_95961/g.271634  ORF Transcript_95961/g.271634 Transcript_95961/m.271634 type:complete len:201 (+) Transcript_95961:1085-1687(+)